MEKLHDPVRLWYINWGANERQQQASWSWNIRFDEVVKGFGFIKNEEEACVYKKESGSYVAFLILYVDDILLIEKWYSYAWVRKDFTKK